MNRRIQQQANVAATADWDDAQLPDDICSLSSAPIDAFVALQLDSTGNDELAATVIQNRELTEAVLKLANSHTYNRNGREICDIKEAVVRLGRRRVSEIALQCIDSQARVLHCGENLRLM